VILKKPREESIKAERNSSKMLIMADSIHKKRIEKKVIGTPWGNSFV
jgi:hypothetical protein